MEINYEDFDYEVDFSDVREALIDIIYQDYLDNVAIIEDISLVDEETIKDIVKDIVELLDLDSNKDILDRYNDQIKDYFSDEAEEYHKSCIWEANYKATFDYGARGTFGD